MIVVTDIAYRWTTWSRDALLHDSVASGNQELAHGWESLRTRQGAGLFVSFAWIRFWLSVFGSPETKIVQLQHGLDHQLIAPLRFRRRRLGPITLKIAETLGTRYLPCNDILSTPQEMNASFNALLSYLAHERHVDIVRLRAIPEESPVTKAIGQCAGARLVHRTENVGCRNRFVEIPLVEEYFGRLPANLRRDQRQGILRLSQLAPLSVSCRCDFSADVCSEYLELYGRSWQELERTEDAFVEGARVLSAMGSLRVMFLRLGGRPIAAQLVAVDGHTGYIMKNFYDRSYAKCSPGTILSFDGFHRAALVDGVRRLDYMKGDQPYKRRWMDGVRSRFDWTLALTVRGALATTLKTWAERRIDDPHRLGVIENTPHRDSCLDSSPSQLPIMSHNSIPTERPL